MKQWIFGMVCCFLVILYMGAIMTVEGRTARENELDNALYEAVEQTMDKLVNSYSGTFSDEAAVKGFFDARLMECISIDEGTRKDSGQSVETEFVSMDMDKPILAVCTTEYFSYPNGNLGSIKRKAVMVEEKNQIQVHHVKFWLEYQQPVDADGNLVAKRRLLRELSLLEGDQLILPEVCKQYSWKDENGQQVTDFSIKLYEDLNYFAIKP